MIPITRIDEYLAVISQDEDATGLPDQAVTRIDTYLSKIAGEAVAELPEPVTRIDRYLASIAGMDVVMYDPITRIDYYLATVAGVYSGELPEPVTRIDHYLYNWAEGGSLPWQTFTGNPLQFNAPKAHTLKSVKVEFSPKQEGTGDPSPDNVRSISGWTALDVYDDPAYGGAIRWNQLMPDFTQANDSKYNPQNTDSHSIADGVYSIVPKGTLSSTLHYGLVLSQSPIVLGHKYFTSLDVRGIQADKFRIRIAQYTAYTADLPANTWGNVSGVLTASSSNVVSVYAYDDTLYTTSDTIEFKNWMLCDLTEMFGAGNEPTTVEAFRELFPKDYYAYDNNYTETTVSAVNGDPWWKSTLSFSTTVYGGTAEVAEDGTATGSGTWENIASYNGETITEPWLSSMDKYVSGTTPTTGAQVVYKKSNATPFTVTASATPTAVAGINTIWSDANGDVTVEARAEAVNLSALQSLNMLLGGRYYNNGTADEPTDEEALNILLGGNTK